MQSYTDFYVEKSPMGFDDTLAAFGLCAIVQTLIGRETTLTLTDEGGYYHLALGQLLTEEMVTNGTADLFPIAALATAKTKLPEGIRHEQYEEVRDQVSAYYKTPREQRQELASPPLQWDIYRAINPSALSGYNSLVVNWHETRKIPDVLFILLDLYAALPNDGDLAVDRWKALAKEQGWKIKPDITRLQIYNPDSGKGQNKPKSDGLSIGNESGFWMSEWLKAVGFYEGALTKLMRGSKDRKTLVLAPRKLTFERHQKIMHTFLESMRISEQPTRFDLVAAIRYARALLERITEQEDPLSFFSGNLKHELVSGFYAAFYKDMGNAIATMNLSFIALPGWITISEEQPPVFYLPMLDELEAVVRQFDEDRSEDYTLLTHLRDFVSGDQIKPFLEFTTGYASYFMSQKDSKPYIRLLSTQLVERIVQEMGKLYADIADREKYPGFHNIARAISESTVIAQWRKPNNQTYEIRYGLHRDLARQAQTWDKFLSALSEFIYTYNAETARAQELNRKPWRPMVEADDIADLLRMKDDYKDSQMVAKLLIAFGSTFLLPKNNNQQEQES